MHARCQIDFPEQILRHQGIKMPFPPYLIRDGNDELFSEADKSSVLEKDRFS